MKNPVLSIIACFYQKLRQKNYNPWGGGGLPYETDGDAGHLVSGCKFWILVSLQVFWAKHQYFMPPRSRLGLSEETQNYAKRNRAQIFF